MELFVFVRMKVDKLNKLIFSFTLFFIFSNNRINLPTRPAQIIFKKADYPPENKC